MEKKIDWSKAPEGATHYCLGSTDGTHWRDYSEQAAKYWIDGEWRQHPFTSAGCLECGIGHVERPAAPTWNGEGLPPVGTVCQVTKNNKHEFLTQFNGKHVRIVAHDDSAPGNPVAVFRVLGETKRTEADYHGLVASCFEPLKTAEQIAAEEREKAITEMAVLMDRDPNSDYIRMRAGILYDAGYRKQ